MKKVFGLLCIFISLVGCKATAQPLDKLTIGVMPSLDSVPIIWAKEKGYFEEVGLDVELIVYSNGNDRDTQIQTGAVDCVVTDLMGLIAMREAGHNVVGVSKTDTIFSMVSNDLAANKQTLQIGMGEISVTQYAADRGLSNLELDKQFIDAIPQRLEMIKQGLLDAGILPEPMASMASLTGLNNDALNIESPNLLMLHATSLKTKAASIKAFYTAYNKAVDTMFQDEGELRKSVVTTLGLNEAITNIIPFPKYSHAQKISESTYNDIVAWMKSTLNMNVSLNYSEVVDAQLLP